MRKKKKKLNELSFTQNKKKKVKAEKIKLNRKCFIFLLKIKTHK